ncbi:exopolyphosphatase/guanosine-5'-triphosphate,3'-diphosphate pyrophosphatase [Psychromicrobium silvestre]|uniref:Exopolyphosphatase/guanosine-5'-triphosphate, 3'-diphosphate pyrophosphatase n=1 Tax=Psychromicrobium silvestre TaxID=1645614 RepID=A0A7Y9LVT9_9MICC|nr:Ppx/GppA phosphatase family protein [Psychromicrobium silvestre]NYE96496.1 exopolyphosphatase/guanosine-5'-triphosphate,3'-diphosphate pyrophosphatase [Psychromicrobium silvestre]
MSRVAAIDCGTNSIRLLIAELEAGQLTDLHREMRVVRLGQGVDASGEFAADALQRTFAAIDDYAKLIRQHQVDRVRFVATSATRDAANRQLFIDGVRERLGVEPDVVPGSEEAALSFAGAASVLPGTKEQSTLVVDLGGGSTEFVIGTAGGVTAAQSVDMGCVRFTERYLKSDPPSPEEIVAAQAEVQRIVAGVAAEIPLDRVDRVIGVAGTITTVTAHALALPKYQPDAIDGRTLSLDQLHTASVSLLGMSRAERAALPYMHPGRVDVIGAGALLWSTILSDLAELTGGRISGATSSEHDILDGIALSMG